MSEKIVSQGQQAGFLNSVFWNSWFGKALFLAGAAITLDLRKIFNDGVMPTAEMIGRMLKEIKFQASRLVGISIIVLTITTGMVGIGIHNESRVLTAIGILLTSLYLIGIHMLVKIGAGIAVKIGEKTTGENNPVAVQLGVNTSNRTAEEGSISDEIRTFVNSTLVFPLSVLCLGSLIVALPYWNTVGLIVVISVGLLAALLVARPAGVDLKENYRRVYRIGGRVSVFSAFATIVTWAMPNTLTSVSGWVSDGNSWLASEDKFQSFGALQAIVLCLVTVLIIGIVTAWHHDSVRARMVGKKLIISAFGALAFCLITLGFLGRFNLQEIRDAGNRFVGDSSSIREYEAFDQSDSTWSTHKKAIFMDPPVSVSVIKEQNTVPQGTGGLLGLLDQVSNQNRK